MSDTSRLSIQRIRKLMDRVRRDGPIRALSDAAEGRKADLHRAAAHAYLESIRNDHTFAEPLHPDMRPDQERRFWRQRLGPRGYNLLSHFSSRHQPHLMVSTHERESLTDRWLSGYPEQARACRLAADRFCEGDFRALVPDCPVFGDEIPWRGFFHKPGEWPLKAAVDYPDFDSNPNLDEDPRPLWELNRFQHTAILGGAYWAKKDERYAVTFRRHVESWLDQNPYGRGPHWLHAQEAALRAISFTWGWVFFAQSRSLDDVFRLRLLEAIHLHARFVARTLSDGPVTHNHLVTEACALTLLAEAFPEFRGAGYWRRTGRELVQRELVRQVDREGIHAELAPGYHLFVLESFLQLAAFWRANHTPLTPEFEKRLIAMAAASRSLLKNDGSLWRIGDIDDARALRLPGAISNDRRGPLALAAALFNRPDLEPDGNETPEVWPLWLAASTEMAKPAAPKSRVRPAARFRVYHFAGLVELSHGDTQLLFRAGAKEPNRHVAPNHQHADLLNIQLAYKGFTLFDDPGVFHYNPSMTDRSADRATAIHGAPQVDGHDAFEIDKQRFGVGPIPPVTLVTAWFDGFLSHMAAQYEPPAGGLLRRDILVRPDRFVAIIDRYHPGDARDHRLSAGLITGLDLTGKGQNWYIVDPAQNQPIAGLIALYPHKAPFRHMNGDAVSLAPRYGQRSPAQRLSWNVSAYGELNLATLICLDQSDSTTTHAFRPRPNGFELQVGSLDITVNEASMTWRHLT